MVDGEWWMVNVESRVDEKVAIPSRSVELESVDACCGPSGHVLTFGSLGLKPSGPLWRWL